MEIFAPVTPLAGSTTPTALAPPISNAADSDAPAGIVTLITLQLTFTT